MASKPVVLLWPGAESMKALKRALRERRQVELVLSAGLHNAFYSRFEPNAPPEAALQVDVQGGPELIAQLGDIAGLEPLAELEQVLRDDGWRVAITSPNPAILLLPP